MGQILEVGGCHKGIQGTCQGSLRGGVQVKVRGHPRRLPSCRLYICQGRLCQEDMEME